MLPTSQESNLRERAPVRSGPRGARRDRALRQLHVGLFLLAMIGAGLLASALLGGCAQSAAYRPRTTEGALVGNQGTSWEAVFATPMVANSLASMDPRAQAEFSRNNSALAYRPPTAQLASNQWPEAPRPDLAFQRRIHISTRADELLYFRTSAEIYGSSRSYSTDSGYGRSYYYPTSP